MLNRFPSRATSLTLDFAEESLVAHGGLYHAQGCLYLTQVPILALLPRVHARYAAVGVCYRTVRDVL